jgi:bacterioferritin-associated ferredoxin
MIRAELTLVWLSMFKSEATSANKAEHSGCPPISKTDENVVQIREPVYENRCVTISNLTNVIGIKCGPCQRVLTQDLNTQ